jgi:hypothetical protein
MALVKCITALNNGSYRAEVGQIYDSTNQMVVSYPTFFSATLGVGTSTEAASVKGMYMTGVIAVTVPAITDPDIASVDVDISSDPLVFAAAVGDFVSAIPQEAMETNCRIQNAYVIAADSVRVVFGSVGGNVTGGAKNFKFFLADLT